MQSKFTHFNKKTLVRCNEYLIDLSTPLVMGIINLTPDSFYYGSRFEANDELISTVGKMLDDGADIIDVGAVSTRPGAVLLSEEIESARLLPALELINSNFSGIKISVDTFRSAIAREATNKHKVCFINDISGGTIDKNMFETIAFLQVPYILMHIKGIPQDMQLQVYENFFEDVMKYFSESIFKLKNLGANDIIIDPGFGFGKSLEQNYELLNKMDLLKVFEKPVLAGLSRKSMINKLLDISPDKALNGTTVLNTIALSQGADILRVHDVKEAKETVRLFQKFINSGFSEIN